MRLLTAHGRQILDRVGRVSALVELGSGSGEKLMTLVAGGRRTAATLELHLIDVSRQALTASASALASLECVHVVTHEATYEAGLADFTRERRGDGRTQVLFLRWIIGNFDPPGAHSFVRAVRSVLAPGDAILLGADLVKLERRLLVAYDYP